MVQIPQSMAVGTDTLATAHPGARATPLSSAAIVPLALLPSVLLLLLALMQDTSGAGASGTAVVALTLSVGAAVLGIWAGLLLWDCRRSGRALEVQFLPLAPHYVQASVQFSIYLYWGWYWREVYDNAVLIAAQILLAYGLEMLLSLTRRGRWALGFGPFPIIFSTNLFLLFRPEWFYLQFAMVTVGILGKEFLRWQRDGRSVHIFNPSALSLFVFSIALIVTDSTAISYAEEIATTLNRPPYIYLQIFLLGLVVQSLFSVTLVTLMSALALLTLNLVYTGATGSYWFVDSNIPIAVFLGLHLLITDPSTSPRTGLGKALFGLLYGSAVFGLYGLLGALGAPTFYDKLLCVPVLNLMVPLLDAAARRLRPVAAAAGSRLYSEISPRSNRRHMLAWIALFVVMFSTHFVGPGHPGTNEAFWENACEQNLHNTCRVLFDINWQRCEDGDPGACLKADELVASGTVTVEDPLARGQLLSAACDRGDRTACRRFREYIESGGAELLAAACAGHDYGACFMSGLVSMYGIGVPADPDDAIAAWETACTGRWPVACGFLGDSYLQGRGVIADPARAATYLETACEQGYGTGCATLGEMYQRGRGVPLDAERGSELLREACQRGVAGACTEG